MSKYINKYTLLFVLLFYIVGIPYTFIAIRNYFHIKDLEKNGLTQNVIIKDIRFNDTETGIQKIISTDFIYKHNKYFLEEAVYKNKDSYKKGDAIKIIYLKDSAADALIFAELDIDSHEEGIIDGLMILICPFLLLFLYKGR